MDWFLICVVLPHAYVLSSDASLWTIKHSLGINGRKQQYLLSVQKDCYCLFSLHKNYKVEQ